MSNKVYVSATNVMEERKDGKRQRTIWECDNTMEANIVNWNVHAHPLYKHVNMAFTRPAGLSIRQIKKGKTEWTTDKYAVRYLRKDTASRWYVDGSIKKYL